MPAEHHIDTNARLIITTWKGDAIDIDFIKAIEEYQKNIQCHPDYIHFNEVVNLCDIGSIQLTTAGLKSIGKIASRTDNNANKRKLAFIANSNKAFFFTRLYKAYRSFSRHSNKDIAIFSNERDAFEWVK